MKKTVLWRFKLSKLSVKAHLSLKPSARNPTTSLKSYQYKLFFGKSYKQKERKNVEKASQAEVYDMRC